tara:strand:- start:45 stop:221 length:177 start_codon:yes stop_codon:yes gene_type:complete
MADKYKYNKCSITNVQTDVVLTKDNGDTVWIALDQTEHPWYLEWKEWEAAGNTTEAAD